MIKYQDLIGKPAFSVEEGRNWGKIIEILIDINKYTVKGVIISGTEDRFLPFSDVSKIGESVVFKGGSALHSMAEGLTDAVKASAIHGLKAITEAGGEAGTIVSFYFKHDTGEITHYEISKDVLQENMLMSQDGIVKIGPDAAIILNEAVEVMEEMRTKDAVRKTANALGKKISSFASMAGAKAKEYGNRAGNAAKEIKDSAKGAADKLAPDVKRLKELAGEGYENTKKGVKAAGEKVKEAADKYGPKIKEAGKKAEGAVREAWEKIRKKGGGAGSGPADSGGGEEHNPV
jgi:uncharacterized protein YrrD